MHALKGINGVPWSSDDPGGRFAYGSGHQIYS